MTDFFKHIFCGFLGSGEPGGARFGNFINYYEFNPPQQRLGHITSKGSGSDLKENPAPNPALEKMRIRILNGIKSSKILIQ